MHYPPISETGDASILSVQLEEAGVDVCVFGHIHHAVPFYLAGPKIHGVKYLIASSDQLDFRPLLIGEDGVFDQFE